MFGYLLKSAFLRRLLLLSLIIRFIYNGKYCILSNISNSTLEKIANNDNWYRKNSKKELTSTVIVLVTKATIETAYHSTHDYSRDDCHDIDDSIRTVKKHYVCIKCMHQTVKHSQK